MNLCDLSATTAKPRAQMMDLNGNRKLEQELGKVFKDPYEVQVIGNEKFHDNSGLQNSIEDLLRH